ncbi:putative degenerate transposase [Trichinella spiralis]|uniref:putative degenerate transposase n=1 Tax=Trichinella spiralis TaxID=6334 RepID=UPI0001EFD98E|nr:putative degenerate transposase [Trichinella spiralis]
MLLVEEMTENAGNGQCVIQVKGRDLTSAILNAAFAHLGRIRNTCISRNRTTAILVFEREEAAQMAVDVMNGVIIGKDSVTISMFPDIKEKVETLKDDLTEQAYIALNTVLLINIGIEMNGHLLQNLALQISLLQENASTSGEHGQRDSNFRIASGKTISVRTKPTLLSLRSKFLVTLFSTLLRGTIRECCKQGGFVEFVNPACVSRACSEMNGKYLEDMKLITSVFVCSPHTNFNCLADPAMLDVELPVAMPFKWLVTTFSPFGKLTYVSLEENGKY